jgi:predicted nucleic acid-binding protein
VPDLTLVVAIGAVAVSALTAIAIARQVSEARKANALAAVIDLFREYRSVEMERALRLLASELAQVDPSNGMRGLPDNVAAAASLVSQYLDNLGVLVAHGLVDPELTAGFLGDSLLRI